MLLLAVPFVFGSLRSVSIGQRVFLGVIVGVSFHLMNRLFSYTALVYDINPLLAVSLPGAFFLVVAVWILKRVA